MDNDEIAGPIEEGDVVYAPLESLEEQKHKLWEDKQELSYQISTRAFTFYHQWKWAEHPKVHQTTELAVNNDSRRAWQKPIRGTLKCNMDACFTVPNKVGIGLCLRDEGGAFVKARTVVCDQNLEPHEGEALGLLIALEWTRDLGLSNVVFELDAKLVVDKFHSNQADNTICGAIIRDCKELFSSYFINSVIEYTRKKANVVAHTLARVATNMANPQDFDDILFCIVNLIINEIQ